MKTVILLSGGLDSCVVLAMALEKKRECYAVSFDYGQHHRIELAYAQKIARHYGVSHRVLSIDPHAFQHSSLISGHHIPKQRSVQEISIDETPATYVPARNTLFIAYAIGQAEILDAQEIHIGVNAMDSGPYPDCRPAFFHRFQQVINIATRQAFEGAPPHLLTPLIHWDKREIVKEGRRLNVPFFLTFSCYDPTPKGDPCECCDACVLRSYAFS
ncbi:MAG: 7-cyano-7-deazaguanine synthase QueC [Waddliaceae bacterium]